MIFKDSLISAEVSDRNWPLVVDLLVRWGYEVPTEAPDTFNLNDLSERLHEFSAWGIPWKRI